MSPQSQLKGKELAQELKEAGFPSMTRWEVENNYRRPVLVQGEALPPLGALLSEINTTIAVEKLGTQFFTAYQVDDFVEYYDQTTASEWEKAKNATGFNSYRDDKTSHNFYGDIPEEAVAKLYIALKNK